MLSNINNNDFGRTDQMIRFVHAVTSNIDGDVTDLIILDFATLRSINKFHTGAYCTIRLKKIICLPASLKPKQV